MPQQPAVRSAAFFFIQIIDYLCIDSPTTKYRMI